MEEEYLLKKWLVGKLTDAELEDFKKSDYYKLNIEIVEKAAHFDVPTDTTVKSYDDFKKDTIKKPVKVIKLKPYTLLFRIASIFIIGIGIYSLFFFNNITTIKTTAGQHTTFELPDASSVVLNADSKAAYNKKRWTDNREVSLEGEAFFKVAKGAKFDVVTANGTVSVLGTQFNVKNRAHYFEVKCFEGIVNVLYKGKIHRLIKGSTYRVINDVITLNEVSNNQPTWINKISSFKGVPLYEVIDEFERQYDVTLSTPNIDTKRLFSGSFVNTNLEQALASITIPFNLTYKKDNPNRITLYKKQ